jgi:hypothetical protein
MILLFVSKRLFQSHFISERSRKDVTINEMELTLIFLGAKVPAFYFDVLILRNKKKRSKKEVSRKKTK